MSVIDISITGIFVQEADIPPPTSPQDQVPLREPTFYILLSLSAGPQHGYAIMKDVAFLSEGRTSLSTSTLYTALKRLLDLEWIGREEDPAQGENSRERKFYRLTEVGVQVLEAEVARLEGMLRAAQGRALEGNS
jgi:DNA-binding PadR family transcriptional regulator